MHSKSDNEQITTDSHTFSIAFAEVSCKFTIFDGG